MDGPEQPPIHFGGVQLQPFPGPLDDNVLRNAPAGEGSAQARLVAVSRASLAARIKHGVPLHQLVSHVTSLAVLEENLLSHEQ